MKVKDIKLLVQNGGETLNKEHLDCLFKRIEIQDEALKTIGTLIQNKPTDYTLHVIKVITDAISE